MNRQRNNRSFHPACAVIALCAALPLVLTGCDSAHGRPGPGPDVPRPEEELRFATLFKENCSGCHGDNGRNGAAISLSNPVFIAIAKDDLSGTITQGVPEHLMPAFGKSAGGTLTDKQVAILAQGIIQTWGDPKLLADKTLPPYTASLDANVARGQQAFGVFCARCHGADGTGGAAQKESAATPTGAAKTGSIVDPSFLALMSEQNLRSVTIAGRPDQGMPDWRSDAAQPMTDQQITDIVAWIVSKSVTNPGQPYPTHK
jgi:mono/diheme cytochrome c family protein